MPSVRLASDEIDIVLAAALPLDRDAREPFVHAVMDALQGRDGPGLVWRVCKEIQPRFFRPPVLGAGTPAKYR
jgi:hypothetical protein